ncbi:hypothetical protein HBA54_21175 [Pelagibius litoralis]|uniref:Uncharacterized protein n=1 Tax=Pelagibius litoralis TaxID=374515 RepID=A0A967KF61_9PROT|nr:hypothetical protein [Pelagibius litoralis]NIA71115.1 hypothetical protein [Pelagibius litoralis]
MAGKGMGAKAEFPPLLLDGLHKMDLASLKTLVVDGFPKSARRLPLWNNFVTIAVDTLSSLKLPCEIWVDGSYLTQKIDPDDIDFVVDFPISVTSNISVPQKQFIEQLAANDFHNPHKLHSFVMFSAPIGHNYYPKSELSHSRWKKDFGQSLTKKKPKGIAVLEVSR